MTTSHGTVPVLILGGPDADGLADLVAASDDGIASESWHGPGSVLLGHDVTPRVPGSQCCALRLDVIDGVLRAVRRARRPKRVLLVAGADDDIATIAYTVLADSDLMRHVHLGGVVMAVDAVATATRLASGGSLGQPVELDALAIADLVILGRTSELTREAHGRLGAALRELNAIGSTAAISGNEVTPDAQRDLRRAVASLDAWRTVPLVDHRRRDLLRHGGGDGDPRTVLLQATAPLDPDAVDAWQDRLVEANGPSLLRWHGSLALESEPTRVLCHGVRCFATSHPEAPGRRQPDRRDSFVIVIGHGLDVDELASDFAATTVR